MALDTTVTHLPARYTVWAWVTNQVVSPTNLSYWQLFPLPSYYKACLDVLNYLYNWTQWLLIATDQPMCKPEKKIYHFQIMQFVFSFNDVYTAACLAFSVPIATIFVPSGFDCQSVSYHELVSQHVTILLISFIPRECVPQLRNRIFGLFSKCGKNQWDCEIVRSKQAVNVTYRGICHKICETLQGTVHYRVLWLAEGSWGRVSRASQAIMLPDLIPEYLILCSRLFFLWRGRLCVRSH